MLQQIYCEWYLIINISYKKQHRIILPWNLIPLLSFSYFSKFSEYHRKPPSSTLINIFLINFNFFWFCFEKFMYFKISTYFWACSLTTSECFSSVSGKGKFSFSFLFCSKFIPSKNSYLQSDYYQLADAPL